MTASGEQLFPSFLVIGAQRAGTTWLWRNLSWHPEVWLPPVKELHYFDRSPVYPSPSHLSIRPTPMRVASAAFRRRLRRRLRIDARRPGWSEKLASSRWTMRYFFGPTGDSWYGSLFAAGDGRVRGEATPSYAILAPEDVELVARLLPEPRAVFVIRNPVDRALSHLRYVYGEPIRRGRMGLGDMLRFVDGPTQALRGDYERTIRIWSEFFPPSRFHLAFYDRLRSDPGGFFADICAFLGVRRPDPDHDWRSLPPNSTPRVSFPPELEHHLAAKYEPQVQRLAARYGGPAADWHAELATTLAAS